MHIKYKITLVFTGLVLCLLGVACSVIYYFSYNNRRTTFQAELISRALVSAHMLKQPARYDASLMNEIDSGASLSVQHTKLEVYNAAGQRLYQYQRGASTEGPVSLQTVQKARADKISFSRKGADETLFFYDQPRDLLIVVEGRDNRGEWNMQRLKRILLLTMLGGLAIALSTGYLFSTILLRPIKRITSEVQTISANNLTQRIRPGNASDEWNELTTTLNALLDRLQESFEVQRRFISAASHELNTPLTAISSQLDVALQRERSTPYYRDIMASVYNDVRELNTLTQTLLQFASVSGDPGGLALSPVRIDELLARLPAELAKPGKGYIVKLNFAEVPEDESRMLVFGNEALLLTALKNLAMNACKYSEDKTAIISFEPGNDLILIRVADHGKGIPADDLPHIFTAFFRAAEAPHGTGSGLGLTLVNRIIKLHRGSIDVTSVPGKGTIFSISLPIAQTGAVG
ncbi:MAG: histidine kinase [Ferruginibacter sp.]|nr:histidine kinase [Ferruginibacter sp.]